MSVTKWRKIVYEDRLEILYSSIVEKNIRWTEAVMAFSKSSHLKNNNSQCAFDRLGSPVSEKSDFSRRVQRPQVSDREPGWMHKVTEDRRRRSRRSWTCAGRESDLEQWKHAQPKTRKSAEVTQDSVESDSIVISCESDGTEALDVEGDVMTDNTLWILEDDGFKDREAVVCLLDEQDSDASGGDDRKDMDDSSDSLSWKSTASGPTIICEEPSPRTCDKCIQLFEKMSKEKPTDKKIDYEPSSLSCDTWVLNKTWRPNRVPNVKGRLWTNLSRIRKLAVSCTDGKETTPVCCARPHVFLQRNLSRCKRKADPRRGKTKRNRRALAKNTTRGRLRRRKAPVPPVSPERSEDRSSRTTSVPSSSFCTLEQDRARRVLDFDDLQERAEPSPGERHPPRPGHPAQSKQRSRITQVCPIEQHPEKTSPHNVSWVRKGDFRSLLAEMKGNRSTVVKEPPFP